MRYVAIRAAVLAAAALGAAGLSAQAMPAPAQVLDGHALYLERCGGCHLENGFGTRVLARRVPEGQALLERRESLPAPVVLAVVRNGLRSMPQIREAELSDAQLAAIAAYLEGDR